MILRNGPERTDDAQAVKRLPIWDLFLVVAVVVHRVVLWSLLGRRIDASIEANANWLTWQYLPLDAYRDHLAAALLYLQQTPPLPSLVLGLIAKLAAWPLGVAHCLFALQTCITAATSVLLFKVLRQIGCRAWLAGVVSLLFGLSADVYLLELSSLGQLFYESGAMLLALWASHLVIAALHRREDRAAVRRLLLAAGTLVALAALTRASFSLFFVPMLGFAAWSFGLRRAALMAVPILVLHGGWSVKTAAIYGRLSPATSSWAGLNATSSFLPDQMDAFVASIIENPSSPAWVARLLRDKGYVGWETVSPDYLPPDVVTREADIQAAMGGTNSVENSVSVGLLAHVYERAFLPFVLRHPRLIWNKFLTAYHIFWRPIGDFTGLYVSPLAMGPRDRIRFLQWHWTLSPLPNASAMVGAYPNATAVPVALPAMALAPLDAVSFWSLHVLLPVLLLYDLGMLLLGRPRLLAADVLLLALVVLYGSVLFNAIEAGENMRFRLSVEPEILALTVGLLRVPALAAVKVFAEHGHALPTFFRHRRTAVPSDDRDPRLITRIDAQNIVPLAGSGRDRSSWRVALIYVVLAAIAMTANFAVQQVVISAFPSGARMALPASILLGTATGFVAKYVLDKRIIFIDPFHDARSEVRKLVLYGGFSVLTTLLFWAAEVGAFALFGTPQAKFTGAAVGLGVGYALKYRLDRAFTFAPSRPSARRSQQV